MHISLVGQSAVARQCPRDGMPLVIATKQSYIPDCLTFILVSTFRFRRNKTHLEGLIYEIKIKVKPVLYDNLTIMNVGIFMEPGTSDKIEAYRLFTLRT